MTSISKINKLLYSFFAIAYVVFIYLIYRRTGIVTINEAEKYITAAEELSKGNLFYVTKHYLFYSGYILFVKLMSVAGGLKMVVLGQAALNFIASVSIKKSIDILLGKNNVSIIGMLLFLFSYPLQYWTLTLFSDSFFVAIICITTYYTLKEKSKAELLFWILLCLFLVFIRPPGIFLASIFAFYYFFQKEIFPDRYLWLLSFVVMLILFLTLFYIPVETKGYIKPIAAGQIIIDKPDYNIPEFNNIEKSNLVAAYSYLQKEYGIGYILVLYLQKFVSFFTLHRPYYSPLNNSLLSLHYLLYVFASIGAAVFNNKRVLILFLAAIFFTGNLTALTYNEWHYRFTLVIFPFLIILSVCSLPYCFKKISTLRHSSSTT